jgi:hypothetical protein
VLFSKFLASLQDKRITSSTPLQDLTVAYIVCMSVTVLSALVFVGYKAYECYDFLRKRLRAARDAGVDMELTRREALLAKIAAAKKTCTQHVVAFLVAVFEEGALNALGVIYIVLVYKIPVVLMLSLVFSCITFGMKLDKLTWLKYWYAIKALRCAAAAGKSAGMPMLPGAVGGTKWATGRQSSRTTGTPSHLCCAVAADVVLECRCSP